VVENKLFSQLVSISIFLNLCLDCGSDMVVAKWGFASCQCIKLSCAISISIFSSNVAFIWIYKKNKRRDTYSDGSEMHNSQLLDKNNI